MIRPALFILIQDPEGDADIRSDKKLTRKNDNGFDLIILDQLFSDLKRIAVAQSAIGQQESCNTLERFQMGKNVEDPCIVGVALRRRLVIHPAGIVFQIIVVPAFQIEGRIGHDVVEVKTFEQIVRKSGVAFFAEIMADAAQGQVHLRQTVGCSFLFLTVDIDSPDIAALFPDKIGTLDKHTARAAAGVIKCAVKRLDHRRDQLHNIVRGIELALFFRGVDSEFFQKVLINAADQIFLFAKDPVTDLIDFIDYLFDIVGSEIACGKRALHKTPLQLFAAGSNAMQSSIKGDIQLRCRRLDDR